MYRFLLSVDINKVKASYTGQYLKAILKRQPKTAKSVKSAAE